MDTCLGSIEVGGGEWTRTPPGTWRDLILVSLRVTEQK